MFIAALLTICIHITEYYSAIKRNEILLLSTTWMDLESIMLSKVRQKKTNTTCFHLYAECEK